MSKPYGPLLLLAALLVTGCGSDTQPGGSHDHHHHSGTGEHDHYTPGMDRWTEEGLYQVVFYSEPTPTQGEVHVFRLSVMDADGDPVTNARLSVDVHMPDHGHGSDREPSIEEAPGGVYVIENVSLHALGIWQIDFTIESDAGLDTVAFRFDV